MIHVILKIYVPSPSQNKTCAMFYGIPNNVTPDMRLHRNTVVLTVYLI